MAAQAPCIMPESEPVREGAGELVDEMPGADMDAVKLGKREGCVT